MASGVLLPLRSCLLSSLGPGECGPVGSDPSSLWASLSSPVKGGVWVLHQNHLESFKNTMSGYTPRGSDFIGCSGTQSQVQN